MEKIKAPVFSGRTIEYPEFKRGWQKVAGVHWSDGNQVEQIKHKVDQETRKIITRCNTMKEVWEVLDSEFAQEQKVVNAVDTELNDLALVTGTKSAILREAYRRLTDDTAASNCMVEKHI